MGDYSTSWRLAKKTLIGPGQDVSTPVITYPGDTQAPALNKQIGRFRLLKKARRRGLGIVYLARDTSDDRHVALKSAASPLRR